MRLDSAVSILRTCERKWKPANNGRSLFVYTLQQHLKEGNADTSSLLMS